MLDLEPYIPFQVFCHLLVMILLGITIISNPFKKSPPSTTKPTTHNEDDCNEQ